MKHHKPNIDMRGNRSKIAGIRAKVGDQITWEAFNGDVTIWFPAEHDPLGVGETKIVQGDKLVKEVPEGVHGTFEYSIYVHSHKHMAEGNSPPTVIID